MSKSQIKATHWSVTINNPTANDEENIATARQKGWSVEGQLEKCPTTGTPHYQLYVRTKGQQRWKAMKTQFPRAHLSVARSVPDLKDYVVKPETRLGTLEGKNDLYPSCSKLMSWFGEAFDNYKPFGDGIRDDEFLTIFDNMIHQKIREGYYVEGMAVNPQIRSSIKSYGRSIAFRERLHRQKDKRQTDENIFSSLIIPTIQDACEQETSESESSSSSSPCDETSSCSE